MEKPDLSMTLSPAEHFQKDPKILNWNLFIIIIYFSKAQPSEGVMLTLYDHFQNSSRMLQVQKGALTYWIINKHTKHISHLFWHCPWDSEDLQFQHLPKRKKKRLWQTWKDPKIFHIYAPTTIRTICKEKHMRGHVCSTTFKYPRDGTNLGYSGMFINIHEIF